MSRLRDVVRSSGTQLFRTPLMRRLRFLIPALALTVGGLGLTSCHENMTTYDKCVAMRAGDHWTVIGYTISFGAVLCRATTSAGGFDEYCVFPDGHWFVRRECDWAQNGQEA